MQYGQKRPRSGEEVHALRLIEHVCGLDAGVQLPNLGTVQVKGLEISVSDTSRLLQGHANDPHQGSRGESEMPVNAYYPSPCKLAKHILSIATLTTSAPAMVAAILVATSSIM